jgi:hypothetical protein
MEVCHLRIRGENADQFAQAFVESKATEGKRSLNRRGVRNIHRYQGDGFTQVAYERAAAYEDSWLLVSVLVERVDEETGTVVLFVGGGGEGPFKLEELSMRRIFQGEQSVGQAGRFADVLKDIEELCESLDLEVETRLESTPESSTVRKIASKLFDE